MGKPAHTNPGVRVKIYLVRHGETDANRDGRFQGASDAPINATGRRQAKALGERLKSHSIDAVYSSPQTRARETAAPIARGHDLDIISIDGLRELDIGELDGLKGDDLRERYPEVLAQWIKDVGSLRLPGGESIRELQQRAWAAVEEIKDRHPQGNVVVVSHNFAIQSILCKALALDLTSFRRIRHDLGAISVLSFEKGGPVLISLNDRCHLEEVT